MFDESAFNLFWKKKNSNLVVIPTLLAKWNVNRTLEVDKHIRFFFLNYVLTYNGSQI